MTFGMQEAKNLNKAGFRASAVASIRNLVLKYHAGTWEIDRTLSLYGQNTFLDTIKLAHNVIRVHGMPIQGLTPLLLTRVPIVNPRIETTPLTSEARSTWISFIILSSLVIIDT
jgi:hypothetical protein